MADVKLNITQHCKERYAERIAGKEERGDIAVYVAQHQTKIEEDINKICEYGEVIYNGQLKDKNYVNVILNGTWVLLTDKDMKKAITVYKIDFGLGEEFNKNFVERMLEKIGTARDRYCESLKNAEEQKAVFSQLVDDFVAKVNEYRRMINNLEKQIAAYKELIATVDINVYESESEFRNAVMELVCKKEF